MKKCLRQKCQKEFEPNKPKQVFCSAKCRVYFSRENKQTDQVVIKPDYFERNKKVVKPLPKSRIDDYREQLKPPRLEGENTIDYKIRISELNG